MRCCAARRIIFAARLIHCTKRHQERQDVAMMVASTLRETSATRCKHRDRLTGTAANCLLGFTVLLSACSNLATTHTPAQGPTQSEATATNTTSPPLLKPDPPLATWLATAETEGWLNGNLKAYMALFAQNAEVIAARSPQAGPHEVHFTISAYRTLMHYQFAQPVRAAFTIETPLLELEEQREEGIEQTLRVTQVRKFRGLSALEYVHETFVFEPRDGKWLATQLRYFPLSARMFGDDLYDIAKLPELDAEADKAGLTLRERAYALSATLRYADASALFRQMSAEPGASAADWVSYGYSALFAADPVAAEHAFSQARQLDPLVQLPLPPGH
jgi:hypothetical protein